MAKSGRPTKFNDKIAADICYRLMEGQTLREICRRDDMPARSSVHKWLAENPSFSDQYAQAREFQADYLFEEMFEIADDASNDYMVRQGEEDGEVSLNPEHVQRSRLRIDTRKWALARMAPKKYGEKLSVDATVKHEGALDLLK